MKVCDTTHVRSQLTVCVVAYSGRSNYISPHLFTLKMHRLLWRIRTHIQSTKKTVDPHHHHFPSSSALPIGRVQFFFCKKIFTPLVCSASR